MDAARVGEAAANASGATALTALYGLWGLAAVALGVVLKGAELVWMDRGGDDRTNRLTAHKHGLLLPQRPPSAPALPPACSPPAAVPASGSRPPAKTRTGPRRRG